MNLLTMQLSNLPQSLELKRNAYHTKIVTLFISIHYNTRVFMANVFPLKSIPCHDLSYVGFSILSPLLSIAYRK